MVPFNNYFHADQCSKENVEDIVASAVSKMNLSMPVDVAEIIMKLHNEMHTRNNKTVPFLKTRQSSEGTSLILCLEITFDKLGSTKGFFPLTLTFRRSYDLLIPAKMFSKVETETVDSVLVYKNRIVHCLFEQ